MQINNKVKLIVFEAEKDGAIDKETCETFTNFCEAADLDNTEDIQMLSDIVDYCEAAYEDDEEPEVVEESSQNDEPLTADEIKLAIYESAENGEITAEEKAILLAAME